LQQRCGFGSRGFGTGSRAFRVFEIPRHCQSLFVGGRHNGASTRAITDGTARGQRDSRGPGTQQNLTQAILSALWAEDRLTQQKRRGGCKPRDSSRHRMATGGMATGGDFEVYRIPGSATSPVPRLFGTKMRSP
jgi:hypothetical protein